MSNQLYLEKLKDPRWQKKRLEILNRDNWACQYCEDTTHTLIAHHKLYLPDVEPWDYPNHLLITLCESCHELENQRKIIEKELLTELRIRFPYGKLDTLVSAFQALPYDCETRNKRWSIVEALWWAISDKERRFSFVKTTWDNGRTINT